MIITDLYGTFFNSQGNIAERNIEAVEYFKKNGGFFTIATGRSPKSPARLTERFTPLVNAPAILCNGAFCYNFRREERICEIELNYQKSTELAMRVHRDFPEITVRLSIGNVEYSLSQEESIGIVDGKYENDLDLLTHADIAACPENSIESVKKISKIQLCHCDDGAIADLIEKIEKN